MRILFDRYITYIQPYIISSMAEHQTMYIYIYREIPTRITIVDLFCMPHFDPWEASLPPSLPWPPLPGRGGAGWGGAGWGGMIRNKTDLLRLNNRKV